MAIFIAVHTLGMENLLINTADISYVSEQDGGAVVFLRSNTDECIYLHETLAEVCNLINEENRTWKD